MIKNILCVLKTTSYEHYNLKPDVFQQFDRRRQQILQEAHEKQKEFENKFRELALQLKLSIEYVSDANLDSYVDKEYDLIMTFGGDGTFLNVAQHFKDCLIMGINSDLDTDPAKGSIGALTSVNEHTLATALKRLKKGEYDVERWKRLYAKINGKKLDQLAVNDIYFGALEAYKTTHFELFWNGEIESFKGSSGIIFSTGMGSTSWYRNLGGSPFANDLPIYAFIVRDAQLTRHSSFVKGVVDGEEELVLKPGRSGYVLSVDSKDNIYTLDETDELRIGLSKKEAVRVVRFN